MYSRILLIALLGLMTSACAPYYESGGYYRSDYYSTDRYVSPGTTAMTVTTWRRNRAITTSRHRVITIGRRPRRNTGRIRSRV